MKTSQEKETGLLGLTQQTLDSFEQNKHHVPGDPPTWDIHGCAVGQCQAPDSVWFSPPCTKH